MKRTISAEIEQFLFPLIKYLGNTCKLSLLRLSSIHRFFVMTVFGEIVCFEMDQDISEPDSTVFALFKVKGRLPEVTLVTRGIVVDKPCDGKATRKKVYLFHRPTTQANGQRMFFQLIQNFSDGTQKLLGYGYCDMDIEAGLSSRTVAVRLWGPRSETAKPDWLDDVTSSSDDSSSAGVPASVEQAKLSAVSEVGKLIIHIQRPGYH